MFSPKLSTFFTERLSFSSLESHCQLPILGICPRISPHDLELNLSHSGVSTLSSQFAPSLAFTSYQNYHLPLAQHLETSLHPLILSFAMLYHLTNLVRSASVSVFTFASCFPCSQLSSLYEPLFTGASS